MYLLVNIAEIWYMFAKLITSGVVLTWNFLGNKLWTFKLKTTSQKTSNTQDFDLSIVIPGYNEEYRIKNTLLAINDYFKDKDLKTEIIVVSDGSTDKTNETVENYAKKIENLKLVSYPKNQGKGYAIKMGIKNSKGKMILFTDADNSTPIEEYEKLADELKKNRAQIAIGSRYLKDSNIKIRQPFYRILLGRAGNLIIKTFLIDGIKDTQCGFKLFTHEAAQKIFALQKIKRFGFDMEMLLIARILGIKLLRSQSAGLIHQKAVCAPLETL